MLVLDDADMTLIFKEKGKLNRIIKNCPITSEEKDGFTFNQGLQ